MKHFKEGDRIYVVSKTWKTIHEFIFGFQIEGEDTCFVFPIDGGEKQVEIQDVYPIDKASKAMYDNYTEAKKQMQDKFDFFIRVME